MTFNKSFLPLAVALSLSSTAVLGESPSYTYVEAGGVVINLDEAPVNPTGYYVAGSAEIGTNGVFIHGGYLESDDSYQGRDYDYLIANFGVGYKAETSSDSTWHIYADWVKPKIEFEGGKDDSSGYLIGLGTRGFIAKDWELGGNLKYLDLKDIEDEDGFAGELELVYYFADQFGIKLGGELDENSNKEVTLGIRFEF